MRRCEFLIVIALLATALVSAKGKPLALPENAQLDGQTPATEVGAGAEARGGRVERIPVEPSPVIAKDKVLATAYFSTLSILSTLNECSRFFGGPATSVDVFQQLMSKVEKNYFTTSVGIRMSGDTIDVANLSTKKRYRLFEKVHINTNGPFYRRMVSRTNIPLPYMGTFEPNTKEARVLMFLHELGHVIKGDDGNWLLPNDGKDEVQSQMNTQKIVEVCGEQIKALGAREGKNVARTNLKSDEATPTREAVPLP